jgi:hypothetical protein
MDRELSDWLLSQWSARGLTQADFCRASGLPKGLISQVVNLGKPLPLARYGDVLRGLGIQDGDVLANELRALMATAKLEKADGSVQDMVAALKQEMRALESLYLAATEDNEALEAEVERLKRRLASYDGAGEAV